MKQYPAIKKYRKYPLDIVKIVRGLRIIPFSRAGLKDFPSSEALLNLKRNAILRLTL
jgi:hypothetical protein